MKKNTHTHTHTHTYMDMDMYDWMAEVVTDFLFVVSKITVHGDCGHEIRRLASWQESYDRPRQCVEKQWHYSANKGPYSQGCGLPSGHVRLWKLDHKEGWVPKNWCLRTVVLEKTLEGPLGRNEIKPVNLKGNQPWILTGRTDAILVTWCEEQTHWKSPWCWERLRAEAETGVRGWDGWMASLMPWTWTWANFGRRWETGNLACCSPWGHKVSDTARWLNNVTELLCYTLESPGGSVVKNSPTKQETQVWSLCWDDPLKKEVAIHSSILAWETPWTVEPGWLQSLGSEKSRIWVGD